MPLRFNALLESVGVAPRETRLLRHQTGNYQRATPYTVWRDDVSRFERFQSFQLGGARRAYFNAPYWASFVVPPEGGTMFVGIYSASLVGPAPPGELDPVSNLPMSARVEVYETQRMAQLSDYAGRLFIDWGAGDRAWTQRADNQDKEIVELRRTFQEEAFPGFTKLVRPLSELESMPSGWREVLRVARGVYLLACPRTREHYVGSAYGEGGFLGRWTAYVADGHGGNLGLRGRDASDYVVSILEVVGSNASAADIIALEQTWKAKLLSRDMGLNRN